MELHSECCEALGYEWWNRGIVYCLHENNVKPVSRAALKCKRKISQMASLELQHSKMQDYHIIVIS